MTFTYETLQSMLGGEMGRINKTNALYIREDNGALAKIVLSHPSYEMEEATEAYAEWKNAAEEREAKREANAAKRAEDEAQKAAMRAEREKTVLTFMQSDDFVDGMTASEIADALPPKSNGKNWMAMEVATIAQKHFTFELDEGGKKHYHV